MSNETVEIIAYKSKADQAIQDYWWEFFVDHPWVMYVGMGVIALALASPFLVDAYYYIRRKI